MTTFTVRNREEYGQHESARRKGVLQRNVISVAVAGDIGDAILRGGEDFSGDGPMRLRIGGVCSSDTLIFRGCPLKQYEMGQWDSRSRLHL